MLEINKNTKMAIVIAVEYILAQRKISTSTIGIKYFSGSKKKLEFSCSGIFWVVMILLAFSWFFYTDNFPTLNNPLQTQIWVVSLWQTGSIYI